MISHLLINGEIIVKRIEAFVKLRNIPVTCRGRQMEKEEPHDKIEMHHGGCNVSVKPGDKVYKVQ